MIRSSMIAARRGVALTLFLSAALALTSRVAFAQPAAAPPDKPAAAEPAENPAAPADAAAAPASGDASAGDANAGEGASGDASGAPANPDAVPVNIRLRRLEQRVQALKERAWRAKARTEMLKEAVLGGGVGARAGIVHENKMGSSYRLIRLVYALDGTQIFSRNDPSGGLHSQKSFEILTGPIAPGSHTISVLAVYRGHGYGVFKYLDKYKFTVRSSHTFTATEGKATSIRVVAFEKGGVTTPLEDRPAIDFKVAVSEGAGK